MVSSACIHRFIVSAIKPASCRAWLSASRNAFGFFIRTFPPYTMEICCNWGKTATHNWPLHWLNFVMSITVPTGISYNCAAESISASPVPVTAQAKQAAKWLSSCTTRGTRECSITSTLTSYLPRGKQCWNKKWCEENAMCGYTTDERVLVASGNKSIRMQTGWDSEKQRFPVEIFRGATPKSN